MARVGFNVTQCHVDRDCTGSYGEVVLCHPQQGCISSSKNGVVQGRFGGESGEEEDQIAVGNAERVGGGGGGGGGGGLVGLVGEDQEKNLEQHHWVYKCSTLQKNTFESDVNVAQSSWCTSAVR